MLQKITFLKFDALLLSAFLFLYNESETIQNKIYACRTNNKSQI